MEAKRFKNQARQGDVFIRKLNKKAKPAGEQIVDPKRGTVLAYGEVTGHAHAIFDPTAAMLFPLTETTNLLRVTKPTELRHEEHSAIFLDVGDYEVRIQREYAYGSTRAVAD